ncbi:hypothetical protein [Helicobacter suis]|uniref:hypothetical protein n=2 Tax=Helicobacter suis TaxID=104628 RepID=UPI0007DB0451|nr:hypothetical protein [Helicobacter suis]
MGICIFCGQKAGFLRRKHKECQREHLEGQKAIQDIISDHYTKQATSPEDLKNLQGRIQQIAQGSFIDQSLQRNLLIKGVEAAIQTALEDGLLTEQEEEGVLKLIAFFNLSQEDLDSNGYYAKLKQGSILRHVCEGVMPTGINIIGDSLPFVFMKNEKLIWAENGVQYFEMKTVSSYVGGSQGVSLRIAKGVYYRVGAFKGHKIQEEQMSYVDTGLLAITTKHLYFCGKSKSLRIPFAKLISITPYSDGISVHKDGVRAKPQIFINGDSWFLYNLISNIHNLD